MRTTPFLLLAGPVLLAGCASGSGLYSQKGPDEFAVQRQTPLVVPPDFALQPPQSGEPRPATQGTQQQTLDALFGGPAPRSTVESETISRAGTSTPGIRSMVGDPATYSVAKGAVTRDILAAPVGDGREAQTAIPEG
jgi:Protein of unknown function (DUF3035)